MDGASRRALCGVVQNGRFLEKEERNKGAINRGKKGLFGTGMVFIMQIGLPLFSKAEGVRRRRAHLTV